MSDPKKYDAADLAGGRHRDNSGKWNKQKHNVSAQGAQRKRRAAARALAALEKLFGPPRINRKAGKR